MTIRRIFIRLAMLSMAAPTPSLVVAQSAPVAKPVPALQVLPLPGDAASFTRDGLEIARYHFGGDLRRPFVYPVVGPSGRSLTRMGHPRDPTGHSHHNSLWISHYDVNGTDFWGDRGKKAGRIVQQRVLRYEDEGETAAIETLNHWLTEESPPQTVLEELRRLEIRELPQGEWLLTIDLEFRAKDKPVTLGKTPFGLVGVRMAKTIGVNDGGGTIRNSAGGVNEAGVFWKPAKWCDYSGPISQSASEGISLLDHPQNPNHPTVFHVRNDGWMGASLTFDAPRTIDRESPLALRYGFYVHAGVPSPEQLERQWQAFAATERRPIKPGT